KELKTSRSRSYGYLYVLILLFAAVALLQTSTMTSSSSSSLNAQKPQTRIDAKVLADTTDGNSTSVVILLAEQADLSAAYQMSDQNERGWYVYNTLTQHAARTQVGLKEFLQSNGVAYKSFWGVNMLVADADRTLVEKLAARTDFARIDSNLATRWIEDPILEKFGTTPNGVNAPDAAEWGVLN